MPSAKNSFKASAQMSTRPGNTNMDEPKRQSLPEPPSFESKPSSRLYIRNLPKYLTEQRLKAEFSKKGIVTDIKLVKTKEGVFRRFAYIGFKSLKDAMAAKDYFDNTFIDTCRISVDYARSFQDTNLPRAWSKYTPGSSAHSSLQEKQKQAQEKQTEQAEEEKDSPAKELTDAQKKMLTGILGDEDTNDSELKEFLQVMKPRRAAAEQRTWANDMVLDDSTGVPMIKSQDSDDEEYQDLSIQQADDLDNGDMEAVNGDATEMDDTPVNQDKDTFDNDLSDLDWLRRKMQPEQQQSQTRAQMHPSRLAALTGQEVPPEAFAPAASSKNDEDQEQDNATEEVEELVKENMVVQDIPEKQETPPADLIADTGRLLVKNIAFACTPEDLEELFKTFGPISEVHIPIDRDTKLSKGYAFILFLLPEHAVNAYLELDKSIFQGRILEIVPAREKPRTDEDVPGGPGMSSFKKKKEKMAKMNANQDFNWNSLFMNQDAVAEAMARNLGVKKSDILNPDAENMAVRLALAETSIINETKEYLVSQGISLPAFQSMKKSSLKSDVVILVKNIPASTTEEDLTSAFGKFGELGRVVLPPARTLAIVEFQQRNEAKSAFRRLAYSKFKSLPLFLEWAPKDTFVQAFDSATMGDRSSKKDDDPVADDDKTPAPSTSVTEALNLDTVTEDDDTPVATIFVKNLNFETREEDLKRVFEGVGGLRSVRIAKKVDPKTKVKLSMGFGFLEFQKKEDAMRCIKGMQNYKLDGHELHLKFSNSSKSTTTSTKRSSASDDEDTSSDPKTTKLLVRNIPFEATKKDLKQLFSSFSHIKSVRIPRKYDGQHRGFGFIDFLTKQEAKKAFEALKATHLYGRHLVIEWAKDDESVETMRAKTAKTFVGEKTTSKRRRIEMDDILGGEEEE